MFSSPRPAAFLNLSATSVLSQLRETMASMFWDNLSLKETLKDLSRHIYFIKAKIPAKILNFAGKKDLLALETSDKIYIDAGEFENLCIKLDTSDDKSKTATLKKLIELYKGDFLENFFVKEAVEFADWQFLEQERLKTRFIRLLNNYCRHYLEEKKYDFAIELACNSLRIEPSYNFQK